MEWFIGIIIIFGPAYWKIRSGLVAQAMPSRTAEPDADFQSGCSEIDKEPNGTLRRWLAESAENEDSNQL
jgi:hypothetical protein